MHDGIGKRGHGQIVAIVSITSSQTSCIISLYRLKIPSEYKSLPGLTRRVQTKKKSVKVERKKQDDGRH